MMDKKRLESENARALMQRGRQWGKTAAFSRRGGGRMTRRMLSEAEKTLEKRRTDCAGETAPEAEWLLDNFYLVRRDLSRVREALKGKRRLPQMSGGRLRILELTDALTEACGGRPDPAGIRAFLRGVGEETELEEGELGLLEPALRLSLLRYLAGAPERAEAVFTGIRVLDALPFAPLLEEASPVEALLSGDPAGVYRRMDPESRSAYRQQVSRLARRAGIRETAAAERALELAAAENAHVGRYLFTRPLGKAPGPKRYALYFAACLLPAAIITGGILRASGSMAGLLALLPLLEGSKYLTDRIFSRFCPPARLPRLDYSRGIPPESRTLGVSVMLLRSPEEAGEAAAKLERFRLANRDAGENLVLGLLADLRESSRELEERDDPILAAAKAEIDRLNGKYGGGFCLLCRKRCYSSRDRIWRGWERKRGAILDLLDLLGGENSRACLASGDPACLRDIVFLLVLDGDTGLPPGSAAGMAATLAHPLQRAKVDEEKRLVTGGYGILQPRVSVSLRDADRSDFARVFAGRGGLDPYGGLSSELSQDLFGEGSYTGKGLLDIRAARLCLRGRFPAERLLSHDLVEGAYLGCAFAGDLELTDGFPGSILSYFERQHRWIRGDWQTVPWLLPRVKNEAGEWEPNPLTPLSKWKIMENLRRSLLPPAVFLSVFLYGMLGTLPLAAAAAAGVAALGLKVVLGSLGPLRGGRRCLGRVLASPVSELLQLLLLFVFLPYGAWVHFSAVCTALWRMLVSHRRLLQWKTAAESGEGRNGLSRYLRRMFPCTAAGLLGLLSRNPALLALSVFWILAPFLGWAVSRERGDQPALGEEDRVFLLHAAGDIWRYFQRLVTGERNWLPPDNLQETPEEEIAERTSPTNIGLAMLAAAAAWDLGLTDRDSAFALIGHMLDTLERLPRFRGHLFNWYDIRTLAPLDPPYLSTVDSGNFIACLITLKGAAEEAGRPDLAARAEALAGEMPLGFLYDRERKLLRIGWDPRTDSPSGGWYDLLASEARITSYIAVARGEAELKHWRRLGRVMTGARGRFGLASWTGTMFEYLMPELFLPAWPGSLLWESGRFCLDMQRRAAVRGIWGSSESACSRMDAGLHYVYQAQGVQTLALKRGMDRERVIAPYASFLALSRIPGGAVRNLRRLRALGAEGVCGFYEAVDFTPREEEGYRVVRSFMVHHLAMSLLAADNALVNGCMRRRFLRDPEMGAYTELLQERSPAGERIRPIRDYQGDERPERRVPEGWRLCREGYDLVRPACLPLSNGRYHLLITELGGSRSLWEGRLLAATAFRRFGERQGPLFFASAGGRFFSLQPAPEYDGETEYHWEYGGSRFSQYSAREGWQFRVETRVPGNASGELRKVTVRNRTGERQELTLALYFEPALCAPEAWEAHPAFARLALESRMGEGCLLVHRRPGGREPECACAAACSEACDWETDRDALFGRGGLRAMPAALLRRGSRIRASQDPCVLARLRLTLRPGESRQVTFALAMGRNEAEAGAAVRELKRSFAENGFFARCTRAFGLSGREWERALGLITPLVFSTPETARLRESGRPWDRGPDGLWQYGISGDLPVAIPGREGAERMLRSWALLRSLGVSFDLALPVEDEGIYGRPECAALLELAGKLGVSGAQGQRGGFHLAGGTGEQRLALQARCRAVGLPEAARQRAAHCLTSWFLPSDAENREPRREIPGELSRSFRTEKGVGLRAWMHILTNGRMGWIATDAGTGNLFLDNAREQPLTPWENDPLSLWGPERLELRHGGEDHSLFADADGFPTETEYGFGFARWKRQLGGEETEVTAFLPRDVQGLVLLIRLRGWNPEDRLRFFARKAAEAPSDFGLYASVPLLEGTGDELRWMTGTPGGDACLAGEFPPADEVVLALGLPEAARFARPEEAKTELKRVLSFWRERTGSFRLRSPSPRLDAYVNGWALYQILACRVMARCSLYQSGGAFGFRDQLQDVCALADTLPDTARGQILAAAAHQYREGDVMHWWHPRTDGDRGVRTRCSDDLLWLPYALTVYGEKTGDRSILEAEAPWLVSRPLGSEERDRYEAPDREGSGSLQEHGLRAISLVLGRGCGPHGLLRMGSGDWNDGMDAVEGESVWLTWFAALVMDRFGILTGREELRKRAAELGRCADAAWTGEWYLRGWYADGRPLGAPGSPECAIDSLAQSFAVLSGFGDPEKSRAAVKKAAELLLDRKQGTVKVFAPPFNGMEKPGYIRSYLPGVRENGGQYTHAAVWLAAACLRCGETDLGWTLLETLLPGGRPEEIYQGEPYVLAADVYTHPDMPGRAGWTWYTGAAGWFLRTAVEELLGIRLAGGKVTAQPKLPASWPGYEAWLRAGGKTWHILAGDREEAEVREE